MISFTRPLQTTVIPILIIFFGLLFDPENLLFAVPGREYVPATQDNRIVDVHVIADDIWSGLTWRPTSEINYSQTLIGDLIDGKETDMANALFIRFLEKDGFRLTDKAAASELWSAIGSIAGGSAEDTFQNLTKYGAALIVGGTLGSGMGAIAIGAGMKVGVDYLFEFMKPISNAKSDSSKLLVDATIDLRNRIEDQWSKYYYNAQWIPQMDDLNLDQKSLLIKKNAEAMEHCKSILEDLEIHNRRLIEQHDIIYGHAKELQKAMDDFRTRLIFLNNWKKKYPDWEHGSISETQRKLRDSEREILQTAASRSAAVLPPHAGEVDNAFNRFTSMLKEAAPVFKKAREELNNDPKELLKTADLTFPGEEIELFRNGDDLAVSNGGKDAVFVLNKPARLTYILSYHYNDGQGASGGTLKVVSSKGESWGPWNVENVNNVYWIARPMISLPIGTYRIIDSDPDTWAQNEGSGGQGHIILKGMWGVSSRDADGKGNQ